jgi:hypothetical protein
MAAPWGSAIAHKEERQNFNPASYVLRGRIGVDYGIGRTLAPNLEDF